MRNKILIALLTLVVPASAHVSLAENTAAPGAHYLAHFHVGHGCDGAPTTQLRITIPEGVSAVEPQTAPGWTVETAKTGDRISAVTWKGGSLDAKTKGEFVIAMTLPAKPGMLLFPAAQSCAAVTENFSDAPVAGQKPANPAPVLYVGEKAPEAGGMAPGMVMPDGSRM